MLTICPTPIGNLGDVSARQLEALGRAEVIACEDTRVTGKLLELLGIPRVEGRPRLLSYHDHNEQGRVSSILDLLREGVHVVLVSDAGTPGIADPGFRLIEAVREAGLKLEVLPGACAAIVALVASGFPTDQFEFSGFLASKQHARREFLTAWRGGTLVLYESPQRLEDLLSDVEHCHPGTRVFVGRELTKLHEEHLRGTCNEVIQMLNGRDRVRGECVVVLHRPPAPPEDEKARALTQRLTQSGLAPRQIKEIVSDVFGANRSDIFRWMEEAKGKA